MAENANDKRQAARTRVAEMRKAQEKRSKRNKLLLITGVIVFIAAIAAAIFSILSQEEPTLDDLTAPVTATAEKQGIPIGADLVAGTVNEGAPVLDIYFDVSCGYCDQFEEINGGELEQLAADGDVTLVYHPLALLDQSGTSLSGYSGRTAQALAVIADESPEHFIPFMQAAFDRLHRGEEGQAPSLNMAELAEQVGVPADVAESLDDGQFKDWILAKHSLFMEDGHTGTPTVLLEGEDFTNWQQPGFLTQTILSLGTGAVDDGEGIDVEIENDSETTGEETMTEEATEPAVEDTQG